MSLNNKKFLVLLAICTLGAVSLGGYLWYKHKHAQDSSSSTSSSYSEPSSKTLAILMTPTSAALGANCDKISAIEDLLGKPVVVKTKTVSLSPGLISDALSLCNNDYHSVYSTVSKTPIYATQIIYPGNSGLEERTNDFSQDPRVKPNQQAKNSDYLHSSFDRGHMAPATNMAGDKDDTTTMSQSFYFTNMVPQVGPNMNRGIWAQLEAHVTASSKEGPVIVYTGPIFEENHALLSKNKIWVPNATYKAVYHLKTQTSNYYILPNTQVLTKKTKNIDKGNPAYPQTLPESASHCAPKEFCTVEDFKLEKDQFVSKVGIDFFPKKAKM